MKTASNNVHHDYTPNRSYGRCTQRCASPSNDFAINENHNVELQYGF